MVRDSMLVLLLDCQQAQDEARLLLYLLATGRMHKASAHKKVLQWLCSPLYTRTQTKVSAWCTSDSSTECACSAQLATSRKPLLRQAALVCRPLPVHVAVKRQQRHHRLDSVSRDHMVHVLLCARTTVTIQRQPQRSCERVRLRAAQPPQDAPGTQHPDCGTPCMPAGPGRFELPARASTHQKLGPCAAGAPHPGPTAPVRALQAAGTSRACRG